MTDEFEPSISGMPAATGQGEFRRASRADLQRLGGLVALESVFDTLTAVEVVRSKPVGAVIIFTAGHLLTVWRAKKLLASNPTNDSPSPEPDQDYGLSRGSERGPILDDPGTVNESTAEADQVQGKFLADIA